MNKLRNRRSLREDEHVDHLKPARSRRFIFILAGIAITALVALVIVQFVQLQQLRSPAAVNAVQDEAINDLVADVGQHFLLPEEKPTVATVEDAEEIRAQTFFANAENGDKVLIFPDAQVALIYRQSQQLVVNAGPLVLNAADLAGQQIAEDSEDAPMQEDAPAETAE